MATTILAFTPAQAEFPTSAGAEYSIQNNTLVVAFDGGTNEKAVLLMPVGYPRPDATVPDLQRLPLEAIVQWNA